METLFDFLLKASAGIALFYSVYWIFLRNETYHFANRIFLLLALVSSVLIPLFPVHYAVFVAPEKHTALFSTLSNSFKNVPTVNQTELDLHSTLHWELAILFIYITGSALFLLRLMLQTITLFYLILKHKIKVLDGFRIVENEKYGLPFSFFNIVFINPKFHKQNELPEILAHEKVHIRENHWLDLLLIELLTVIFWFNPFIWFFERSIKQNHEYLADKGVISMGHDVARYQALLVNQLMGMQIIGITNNLNFALNTNRLKMMTKKKTSASRRIKFVWALPAVAFLLFAFAKPEYKIADMQKNNNSATLIDFSGQKSIKLKGTVVDEDGNPLPGTSILIKGSTIGTVSDLDGTFQLEVPEKSTVVLSFVGKKTMLDTFEGITSEDKINGAISRKYTMKDAIETISNSSYDGDYRTSYNGELLPPPPPPPPPADGKNPPPPPPPVKHGEEEVFYIVEDMPHFPGGYYAMQDYISKMQQKIAQTKGIKGKAKVLFTVNAKGKISDIKIVEKDNDDAAKGAIMVASGMPDWTPGKQRGKSVPVKYLMPVEFK